MELKDYRGQLDEIDSRMYIEYDVNHTGRARFLNVEFIDSK